MIRNRWKALGILLVVGASPLVTTATCDPVTGVFDFYRNTDEDAFYVYDDCYYDGCYTDSYVVYDEYVVYDDCYYDDCYYEEVIYWKR